MSPATGQASLRPHLARRSTGLRSFVTDPLVPAGALAGTCILAGVVHLEDLAWAGAGALAGYSLSGST